MNTDLSGFIDEAKDIVVFTGAGISTESGIRDYRSQGGIWQQFQPVTIQEFNSSREKRELYWERKKALYQENMHARPNAGHFFVVELEKQGKLKGLITQNIDGLHALAGTSPEKMLEVHGTNLEVICLSCGDIRPWQYAWERLNNGDKAPECESCGGYLKPNTISFGQSLKADVLDKAFRWAAECDLMLVIGSSLVVEPAASIPRTARQNGAKLVIITRSDTPQDESAQLVIRDSIGDALGG